MNYFNYISSEKEFDEEISKLEENQILLLFKYSPKCTISFMIEKEFDSWLEKIESENLVVLKANVISSREFCRGITSQLNITHQSPQLLCFNYKGEVIWHGSHNEINETNLNKLLKPSL